jgi:hypothetical protein
MQLIREPSASGTQSLTGYFIGAHILHELVERCPWKVEEKEKQRAPVT